MAVRILAHNEPNRFYYIIMFSLGNVWFLCHGDTLQAMLVTFSVGTHIDLTFLKLVLTQNLILFVADKVAYALTQGLKIGQIFGSTPMLALHSLQYPPNIVGELKIQQYAMKADCEHGWMSKELEEVVDLGIKSTFDAFWSSIETVCKLLVDTQHTCVWTLDTGEASHIMQRAEMLSNLRYHTSVIISLFHDEESDHQAYEEQPISKQAGSHLMEQKISTHEFCQMSARTPDIDESALVHIFIWTSQFIFNLFQVSIIIEQQSDPIGGFGEEEITVLYALQHLILWRLGRQHHIAM
ncbi:hypothetical protein ACJX0J_030256 [Zea mays]